MALKGELSLPISAIGLGRHFPSQRCTSSPPAIPSRSERPDFGEIHVATVCALGDDGPIGLHSLVVATAVQRSDIMAQSGAEEAMVIVMSNSAAVAPAVHTHVESPS